MSTLGLIISVLMLQSFCAGCYYASEIGWKRTFSEKLIVYLVTTGILLVGTLLLVILPLIAIAGWLHRNVWDYFSLTFILKYMVLKRPLNYDPEMGQKLHDHAMSLNPKWYQVDQKIFIWIDRWVERKYGRAVDEIFITFW